MGHEHYQLTCEFYLPVMYGGIFHKCVCLWGCCFFGLVLGFFLGRRRGVCFCFGFLLYIFNLFSVDSIFLELPKVCRPQIAFYTCQHKKAKSSALACLSDMMPMLLENGFGCHPRILIYCNKHKLYSLTKIPACFSVP